MCVEVYAYVSKSIRVCAYKNPYIHTYAYTRLFISIYELAYSLSVASGFRMCSKKLILVHRISAESTNEFATKKPVCEQRSEYAPTQDVSFMACTINKQVFLRNFSFIIHTHNINSILVVLRYVFFRLGSHSHAN